jgi:hypothetical protein
VLADWNYVERMGEYPQCHADIWLKMRCIADGIPIYNSFQDYAQHMGNGVRSINGGKIDTVYESMFFVGE